MVTIDELDNFLEENSALLEWHFDEEEQTLYICSSEWNETVRIELSKLDKITLAQVKHMLEGGKNVVRITRVTGYFSNIAGWNPGKMGELRDRYRVHNGFKKPQSNQGDD